MGAAENNAKNKKSDWESSSCGPVNYWLILWPPKIILAIRITINELTYTVFMASWSSIYKSLHIRS